MLYGKLEQKTVTIMAQKRRELRSIQDLTDKQKKFIDILVDNWGKITKTDALIESG